MVCFCDMNINAPIRFHYFIINNKIQIDKHNDSKHFIIFLSTFFFNYHFIKNDTTIKRAASYFSLKKHLFVKSL